MLLSPRYDGEPLITLDGPPAAIAEPTIRQRRRLAATLAGLTDEQWAAPSRCEGWTVRDVIVHLDSTNAFWGFSMASGREDEPTRFLATFDPVAGPAELVAGAQERSGAEVGEAFAASTDSLTRLLESLDDGDWRRLAESPPGHVSMSAVAHHALWDSWVHERDILLPLDLAPVEEPDEVAACLRYVAGVAPGLALTNGTEATGVLTVVATNPDLVCTVEVDGSVAVRDGRPDREPDLVLTGDAVTLVEALSMRTPLDQPVPAEAAWLVLGLAEVFEVEAVGSTGA